MTPDSIRTAPVIGTIQSAHFGAIATVHDHDAVEFAVVAPLFFLLLAGIIEFGQVFQIQHTICNASRRGARAGIVDGATTASIEQKVKSQCAATLNCQEADLTVTVKVNDNELTDVSAAEEGDEIEVSVSVPFSKVGSGFYLAMFSDSEIFSTSVLEHE